jgi:hypothetical protein
MPAGHLRSAARDVGGVLAGQSFFLAATLLSKLTAKTWIELNEVDS